MQPKNLHRVLQRPQECDLNLKLKHEKFLFLSNEIYYWVITADRVLQNRWRVQAFQDAIPKT